MLLDLRTLSAVLDGLISFDLNNLSNSSCSGPGGLTFHVADGDSDAWFNCLFLFILTNKQLILIIMKIFRTKTSFLNLQSVFVDDSDFFRLKGYKRNSRDEWQQF